MIKKSFLDLIKKHSVSSLSLVYFSMGMANNWNLDADGFWNDNLNWTPATFPNAVDAVANFPNIITGGRTVSLGSAAQNITIGTLSIETPGAPISIYYNINAGFPGNKLIFETSSGTATMYADINDAFIDVPITLNSTVHRSGTPPGILVISQPIDGPGGLIIDGSTSVEGSFANTYTGLTTVNSFYIDFRNSGTAFGGDLLVNGGTAIFNNFDNIPHSTTITLNDGVVYLADSSYTLGSLNYFGGQFILGEFDATTFSSSGVAINMRNTTFDAPGSASIILSGGGSIAFDNTNNGTAVIPCPLDLGGNMTTLNIANGTAAIDMLISNVISNGGLTKTGTGALELTGSNTYAGGTLVSAGTLQGNTDSLQGDITNNASVVFNQSGTGTYADILSGSGSVEKTGAGTVIFTGLNTYGGGTLVSAGTLQGDATSLQGAITNNATVVFDQTIPGTYSDSISGTGNLVKQGSDALTFTGANTYTGMTTVTGGELILNTPGMNTIAGNATVNGGTLTLAAANQIPNTATVVVSNGTFDLGGFTETIGSLSLNSGGILSQGGAVLTLANPGTALSMQDTTISGNINLTGGGGVAFDSSNDGTATISGNINLGGSTTSFNIANGAATNDMLISGIISNGGLTKTGAGTLTLTGFNTYTGMTTVTGGELILNSPGMTPVSGNVSINGGTLTLATTNQIPNSSTVTVSNGTFDLSGFPYTISALNLNSGGILSQGGAALTLAGSGTALSMQNTTISDDIHLTGGGSIVFNSANNGTATINGNIDLGGNTTSFNIANGTATTDMIINGIISNGGIIKTGTGTLILEGINTYSNGIQITGGTLQGNTDSLLGNIQNNATVVFNQTSSGIFSDSISGSGSLIKQGAGTLTFTGLNTYSGGTFVSAGTLQGNSSNIQGNIQNNGTLIFDQTSLGTQSGMISGTGNLEKQGMGTLILTGTNTYTGGTLITAGTLQGNTASLPGNIINNSNLIFNQTTTGTYSGQLSGSGSLTKQGTGTLILSNANTVDGITTVSSGALIVNNNLSGSGALNVPFGATLGGIGTIFKDCIISGTLAPGNSIDTIHFVGNQIMATGSNLANEITPTTSDLVDVIGTFTLQPGVTLNVYPLYGFYNSTASYLIVQTSGGVTGTFSNVVSSLPLFTFTVDYSDPNNITLNLERLPFTTLVNTGNAGKVAQCFDDLADALCSNQSDVIAVLSSIPTEKALKEAFLQMQPSALTSLAVVQENDLSYIRNALYNNIENDLHSCCFQDLSDEKTQKERKNAFWLTVLDGHTSQKNQDEEPGFIANSPGALLGIDSKYGKKSRLGGALGYTHSHLHWWEKRGTANINALYAMLYGKWASRHAYMQGALIGGYSFYSVHRKIEFGDVVSIKETAKSQHNGLEGSAHLRMGFNFGCKSIAVSPFIGTDYFYIHENSFHESGAKSLNLKVKSKNSDLLSSEAGVDLSHCFGSHQKTFAPFVKLSVIRESRFKGDHEKASLKCGCDFTVSGLYPSRTLAGVAAGFNANIQNKNVSLSYQGKYGNDYSDNSWYLQYSLKF